MKLQDRCIMNEIIKNVTNACVTLRANKRRVASDGESPFGSKLHMTKRCCLFKIAPSFEMYSMQLVVSQLYEANRFAHHHSGSSLRPRKYLVMDNFQGKISYSIFFGRKSQWNSHHYSIELLIKWNRGTRKYRKTRNKKKVVSWKKKYEKAFSSSTLSLTYWKCFFFFGNGINYFLKYHWN